MNEELSPWYKYTLIALIAWMLPVLVLKFSGSLENLSFQSEAWKVLLPGVLNLLTFSILSGSIRMPLKYYVLGLLLPSFQWYFYPESGSYLPALFFIYLTFDHLQHRIGLGLILFLTAFLYPFTIALLPLVLLNASSSKVKNWFLSGSALSLILGFSISIAFPVLLFQDMNNTGVVLRELAWSFGLVFGLSLSIFIVLLGLHLKKWKPFLLKEDSRFDRKLLLYPLFTVLGSMLFEGNLSHFSDVHWLFLSVLPLLMVYCDAESRFSRMISSALYLFVVVGLFYRQMEWNPLLVMVFGGLLFSLFWSMNRTWLTLGILGTVWLFFFVELYFLLS